VTHVLRPIGGLRDEASLPRRVEAGPALPDGGFYEWKKVTVKEKQPYAIAMTEGMMILAGLWSRSKDPKSASEVLSCTILTRAPNDVMAELRDRMPVILAESDWRQWPGEEPASEDELLALLKPCPDEALKMWPVDKAVGNVKNTTSSAKRARFLRRREHVGRLGT
jgi:putative SOS response-associated peptidase YedK